MATDFDYPLNRLRHRCFTRLSDDKVEVFCQEECAECKTLVSTNCIIISEKSDERLARFDIVRQVKPSHGWRSCIHGPVYCQRHIPESKELKSAFNSFLGGER